MNKTTQIIERMKEVKGWKTNEQLAAYFGKSTQAVSSWRSRNSIPFKYISSFCEQEGIFFDQLIPQQQDVRKIPGVAETAAEYSLRLSRLLVMAKAVLQSHTEHATALAYNIQSFYDAVQCTTSVQELQKRVSDLEQLSPGVKPGKKGRLKAESKP